MAPTWAGPGLLDSDRECQLRQQPWGGVVVGGGGYCRLVTHEVGRAGVEGVLPCGGGGRLVCWRSARRTTDCLWNMHWNDLNNKQHFSSQILICFCRSTTLNSSDNIESNIRQISKLSISKTPSGF